MPQDIIKEFMESKLDMPFKEDEEESTQEKKLEKEQEKGAEVRLLSTVF